MIDINIIENEVKNRLSEKRYVHSKNVQKRCEELAKIYNEDVNKASAIGLVHDIAKEMNNEEKIKYAKEHNIEIDEVERENIGLLHAKIGAKISIEEFEFTQDMADAISVHTTGRTNMTMLDKILFVSDAISEDRKFDDVKYIYELSKKDLEKATEYCLDKIIRSVLDQKKLLQIDTVKARNEYLIKNKIK